LDGSKSRDPDGMITHYFWKQTQGLSVILNNSDIGVRTFFAPHVSSTSKLVFSLIVQDNKGAASNSDRIDVTVKPLETKSSNTSNAAEIRCQYVPGPGMDMVRICNKTD
jgi:hypothetical protein